MSFAFSLFISLAVTSLAVHADISLSPDASTDSAAPPATQVDPAVAEAELQMRLAKFVEKTGRTLREQGFELEVRETALAPNEEPVKIRPLIRANTPLTIGIDIPKDGLKNAFVIFEVYEKLRRIGFRLNSGATSDLVRWFELSINAYAGNQAAKWNLESPSPSGQHILEHIIAHDLIPSLPAHFKKYQQWRNLEPLKFESYQDLFFFEGQLQTLLSSKSIENRAALQTAILSENKARARAWNQQKISADLRGLIKSDQKFNDMVKANDRKGVRKLLEAFLPWPLMDDFERETWKTWLEAIEHPNKENSIVMYRGIDNKDHPQHTTYLGKPSLGLFSTVLIRNQGNYTRRLLSLATRRTQEQVSQGAYSVAEAFRMHDQEPKASFFLSFTLALHKAIGFTQSNGGVVIARVDKRRALPNISTVHPSEAEILVPLVVFPDEVLAYELSKSENDARSLKERLTLRLNEIGVTAVDSMHATPSFFEQTRDFIRDTALRIRDRHRAAKAPLGSCRAIFSRSN